MDQNQINALTPAQAERYHRLESLFAHPGWAIVEQWAQQNADEHRDRAAYAQTWDANRVSVGARTAFALVVGLRDATEAEFARLAADAAQTSLFEEEQENE